MHTLEAVWAISGSSYCYSSVLSRPPLSHSPNLVRIRSKAKVSRGQNWLKSVMTSIVVICSLEASAQAPIWVSVWLYISLIDTLFLPKEHRHRTRCVTGPCDVCHGWLHPSGIFLYKELVFVRKARPQTWCEVFSVALCWIRENIKRYSPLLIHSLQS